MVTSEKIAIEQIKSWTTETYGFGFDINRQKRLEVQVARHRLMFIHIRSYFRKCVIGSVAVLMLNGFVMP